MDIFYRKKFNLIEQIANNIYAIIHMKLMEGKIAVVSKKVDGCFPMCIERAAHGMQ